MVSHVCSRSRACSRQVSARAHVDEAAIGGGCVAQGQCRQYRQASGGAATVDRCTERSCDTNDCRQLHPVGDAPSRRAHRGIGQNNITEGWVEAVDRCHGRGCWVGMEAPPVRPPRACGGGRGIPWTCLWALVYRFGVGLHQGPWRGPWGVPCVPVHVLVYWTRVGRWRCHRTFP